MSARGNPLDVYQTIELSWGQGTNKSHRYGELLHHSGRPDRLDQRPLPRAKIDETNRKIARSRVHRRAIGPNLGYAYREGRARCS